MHASHACDPGSNPGWRTVLSLGLPSWWSLHGEYGDNKYACMYVWRGDYWQ